MTAGLAGLNDAYTERMIPKNAISKAAVSRILMRVFRSFQWWFERAIYCLETM